jgi:hypothetical protein
MAIYQLAPLMAQPAYIDCCAHSRPKVAPKWPGLCFDRALSACKLLKKMELVRGIEPRTCALRMRCSTS